MLSNSTILITGGTGSFGHKFIPMTLAKYNPKKIIVFSRDEEKQHKMRLSYHDINTATDEVIYENFEKFSVLFLKIKKTEIEGRLFIAY